ncbi:MAG: hypothetical protein ACFB10_16120 [Salibacteraceae bacterium]
MRVLLLLSVVLFCSFTSSNPLLQEANPYTFDSIQEGVKVSSKMTHSRWKREESPLMLCLKLHNTNTYAVNFTFTMEFYQYGMVAETMEPVTVCLKPDETLVGRRGSLCWLSESLDNAVLQSDAFDWEMNDVSVTALETECP